MKGKECDVLVVGGGAAGLRAGIAVKECAPEARVLLVDKGEISSAGITARAQSDRMAFHATLPHTEPGEDAWKYHALDIYELGGCVSDGDLAVILAQESADAFYYLEELGVPWVKDEEGKACQFLTDGSVYPRACFTGPYTANDIHKALLARAEEVGVEFIENFMLVDLLQEGGEVFGGVFLPKEGGWRELFFVEAGAVVLATGGAGALFKDTLYPPSFTGDGWAAAVRAGAELVNLEFVQLGICSKKPPLACSGSMMRAVPRFIDEEGREFLLEEIGEGLYELVFLKGASWPVSFESQTKGIDIACFRKEREGKIYLDYRRDPEGLSFWKLPESARKFFVKEAGGIREIGATPYQRLRQINEQVVEFYRARGVALENTPIEVSHAAQHFQGGVKIRQWGETNIKGLFACGECAGGQHGANRPGGNALLDTQVFGRRAGYAAADVASKRRRRGGTSGEEILKRWQGILSGKLAPWHVKERVQEIVQRACGVIRCRGVMEEGLHELEKLASRGVEGGGDVWSAVEAYNMLQVARLFIKACMMREESRGPHLLFEDEDGHCPVDRDEKFNKYIVLKMKGDEITAELREPAPLPEEVGKLAGGRS